jgi:hypothetical protein
MAENETPVAEEQAPEKPQIPGIIAPPELDMSWAKVPTERPPRPKIGDEGFTLKLADAGSYGDAPDRWPYENDMPRGAYPTRNTGLPAPYTIYDKYEVWAENSADLYELAIKEQWKPATEISWNSIEALPEHTELALDQVFSNISEQEYNSLQVMGGWFQEISYGYHEVKLYLSTQVFDQARHVEAFRKRALSNGGGLGVQSPGFFNRAVYATFKFSEYVVYVNIIRTSFLLGLCEFSDKLARSQADRQLFDNMANDLRRHLAFGIAHLKNYAQQQPFKRRNIHAWLDRGEMMMAADMKRDKAMREALILAMGDTIVEGKEQLKALRQAQLTKYLRTLEAATVPGREVLQTLKEAIETP